MKISRAWAMPSPNTFSIKPIGELVGSVLSGSGGIGLDPFARNSPFKKLCLTNDIDPNVETDYHMDALDFLAMQPDQSFGVILFDPPYSPRQVSECYKGAGKKVNMKTTSASFWSGIKNEISRVCKVGGHVVTCGWNSGGIGKSNGFEIVEILMVAHGGWHNDTIVTVERKT